MGFSEIVLIGVDHKYSKMIGEDGTIVHSDVKKNHFGEMRELFTSAVFNQKFATLDYEIVNREAKKRGIKIYNATRGGCLEVFERKNLYEIQ